MIGNKWVIFVLTFFISYVQCENILYLSTVASPSHEIWNRVLAKGLQKQHNVTFLSTEQGRDLGPNVHTIHMEEIHNELNRNLPVEDMISYSDANSFDELNVYNKFCNSGCSGAFKSKGLLTLLDYPKNFKFDLIVYDYCCGPCFLFLLDHFNYPPMVAVSAFGNPPFTVDIIGGHNYHAYVPYYGLTYNNNMNFWQRSLNFIINFYNMRNRRNFMIPEQDAEVRKHIKKDFPYLADLDKYTNMALVNTHPSFDFAEPLPPNVIGVGGLQIEIPKSLPKDLEEFIEKSTKGAVLFSLGTNIRSDELGSENQIKFLKAFQEMPEYHFLWKFETDQLPMKLPKNVMVRPFLPQNDILAHPKVKAFISHTGMLSSLESSWHGVPIVAIPFLCDQHRTTYNLVEAGVANSISINRFTSTEFKGKVLEILENPKYRQNMQKRSKLFQDQPEKPIDRAVWWINWVLRNPKATHLQSPVTKLGHFKANAYDIIVTFTIGAILILYVFCKIIGAISPTRTVTKIKKN